MPASADTLVNLLSQWLARHVGDRELHEGLVAEGPETFAPEQAEALEFLLSDLEERAPRAQLEVSVRETLEALALG